MSAEQHLEALDLVVGADGSGVIDAAQLARWGVEPGGAPARRARDARGVDGAPALPPRRSLERFGINAELGGLRGGKLRGELSELSVPEIRDLVTRLVWHLDPDPNQVLHWSHWRRKHQARARRCHYATREAKYVRL